MFRCNFAKTLAGVLKKERPFSISRLRKDPLNWLKWMTVKNKQIDQAVVVVIEEPRAKAAEGNADLSQSEFVSGFVKRAVTIVVPERIRLLGKVGYENILIATAAQILGINPHSSTCLSVWVERAAGFQRHFGERPIAVV